MSYISHVEVPAGGSANITFMNVGNIPSTYTDLLLLISARSTHSGSFADLRVGLNGSTSNLTIRRVFGTGSSTVSDAPATELAIGNASGATSNIFSSSKIYIPNYLSSNSKSMSSDSVAENNSTLAYMNFSGGVWSPSPQAPVTSIVLTWNAGNFVQYSSATLYGITKGSSGGVTVS